MKKTWIFLLAALALGCSTDEKETATESAPEARTQIPDANFESALVDLDLDDQVDGSVATASIEFITFLNVDNRGISDLSGISGFRDLVNLSVRGNSLTGLDVSSNTSLLFIWAEDNALTSLTIGVNPEIEKVGLSGNDLASLNLEAYTQLQLLTLADNRLGTLDVSMCPDLITLSAEGNPLECIRVSPSQLASIPAGWTSDPEDTYSENCP
ncbi:hypothetical protein [Robiginitalea sp. SC105]|uniref:hypothetical protein n=1 Tax=Robiginitalea sp. SC105 TaxID=2762332 RepID=UPI0016398300|nr:hypothetical protein [Robiginitalea sp. SC105]MBC2839087.1 hypothetical protein [Robiginitalea sp. SC105]